jgi:hypothetical protein
VPPSTSHSLRPRPEFGFGFVREGAEDADEACVDIEIAAGGDGNDGVWKNLAVKETASGFTVFEVYVS